MKHDHRAYAGAHGETTLSKSILLSTSSSFTSLRIQNAHIPHQGATQAIGGFQTVKILKQRRPASMEKQVEKGQATDFQKENMDEARKKAECLKEELEKERKRRV